MARVLVAVGMVLLLLTGSVTESYASEEWCEYDPVVLVTTPGGHVVPVYRPYRGCRLRKPAPGHRRAVQPHRRADRRGPGHTGAAGGAGAQEARRRDIPHPGHGEHRRPRHGDHPGHRDRARAASRCRCSSSWACHEPRGARTPQPGRAGLPLGRCPGRRRGAGPLAVGLAGPCRPAGRPGPGDLALFFVLVATAALAQHLPLHLGPSGRWTSYTASTSPACSSSARRWAWPWRGPATCWGSRRWRCAGTRRRGIPGAHAGACCSIRGR